MFSSALDSSPQPEPFLRLSLVATMGLNVLLYLEQCRVSKPSDLATLYLLAAVLSDLGMPQRKQAPEDRSGILGRLFLVWVTPTVLSGYRNMLLRDDLPSLSQELRVKSSRKAMVELWRRRAYNHTLNKLRVVTKSALPGQKAWNTATQHRVAATSSMLGSMKVIKMLGLQHCMVNSTLRLRKEELDTASKVRWIMVYYNASG
ncbi:hypothetical protein NEMBOFW57_008291 [Staphylotrichum longicolle]|uniref:Uncharacterized protein n=1 Tax=Staphylotrichum longicolle TaxID=669026 RepID=A0AAD4ERP6_9PEZI|nr:hypothetical protein NEMBOFW57_008291 [Staphylotrichum longicolle]